MIYPNKKYLTVQDWANRILNQFPAAQIPIYFEPWQRWAEAVIQAPIFSSFSPPPPRQYNNWYDWAEKFWQLTNWTLNEA